MTKQTPRSNTSDTESNDTSVLPTLAATIAHPASRYAMAGIALVMIATAPAAAQELGSVYCDTAIEGILGTIFSAMLGLGLPVSLLYTGFSGFRYMRAGGNPEKEMQAKQKLYYGSLGLMILLLVLVLPEIADKIFGTVGAGFSDCVKPF